MEVVGRRGVWLGGAQNRLEHHFTTLLSSLLPIKIQDYYLIREVKTWLNINHITGHNNAYCMF